MKHSSAPASAIRARLTSQLADPIPMRRGSLTGGRPSSRAKCGVAIARGRGPTPSYAQQTLASVIRTAQQRHLNPHALLASMLQSPAPLVPLELQSPAAN